MKDLVVLVPDNDVKFGIDIEAAWDAVEQDIPTLKREIETLLKNWRKNHCQDRHT